MVLGPPRTSILDLPQVLLESFQNLCFLSRNQFTLDFCKGKMHNIVMMQLLCAKRKRGGSVRYLRQRYHLMNLLLS